MPDSVRMESFYVIAPDIREGMTLSEYRRNRPLRAPMWRRILGKVA